MRLKELLEDLKKSNNKLKILEDYNNLKEKYEITEYQLVNVIQVELSDEEKKDLFECEYIKQFSPETKKLLIQIIKDPKIRFEILKNNENLLGITDYDEIIMALDEDSKIELINNNRLRRRFKIETSKLANIISELSEEKRMELLREGRSIKRLNLTQQNIASIISKCSDEHKIEILQDEDIREALSIEDDAISQIISSFSTEVQNQIIRSSTLITKLNIQKIWLGDIISRFSESQILSILYDERLLKDLKIEHERLAQIITKISANEKMRIINSPERIKQFGLEDEDFDVIVLSLPKEEQIRILYDFEKGHNANFKLTGNAFSEIVQLLPEGEKIRIINDKELAERFEILQANSGFVTIILSLSERERINIIKDEKRVKQMQLSEKQIAEIIETFSEDEILNILKDNKLLSKLKLEAFGLANIIKKIPEEEKIAILENVEFMKINKINPCEIVRNLPNEQQEEIAKRIMNINIPDIERREILATLNRNVKNKIDTSNLPPEYVEAINLQTNSNGKINIDFESDLEQYRGYDAIIKVNPEWFDEEGRKKVLRLCEICPNAKMTNELVDDGKKVNFESTGREYVIGEEWVESVLSKLKPEYSLLQKIAIIDNEVGKRISYSPDFDAEVFVPDDSRTLWRIMATKHGVCNGIASVERYLINRAGLESELISSENHTFIKLNDIEIPTEDGTIKRGNTIIDPTWNLASHKFGAKPKNLFISYEEARKNDIDSKGKDHKAHQNDEKLSNAMLTIGDKALRKLFASLNLANGDGSFPIEEFLNKSKEIDIRFKGRTMQNVEAQFQLIMNQYPELIRNENEIMTIMGDVLDNKNIKNEAKKIVINRVYDRNDIKKSPVMYTYIKGKKFGEIFYVVNEGTGSFDKMDIEEFTKKYECYEQDLQLNNRIRPWLKKSDKEKEQVRN